MDLLVDLQDSSGKRAQIERQLREAIRSGRLAPGTRLPASRVLADELGLARGTVLDAYDQLIAEGYLIARRGSGTRVSSGLAHRAPPAAQPAPEVAPIRFDLRSGITDASWFPRREWGAATANALRELPDAALVARHRGGLGPLREALAAHLAMSRGTAAPAGQVVVTAGLAYGLAMALGALRAAGTRRVAVEDPCWPLHVTAVQAAGLESVHARVDDAGLDVAALEATDADAVIVTPAHQYPTGVVLSADRRAALIDWARRRDAVIIEDDYDAEYRFDREPVASLQGLAPDRVLYLGTTSKTLIPTLRLGWVVAPGWLAERVERDNARLGAWPSVIEQAALARLIDRGQLQRHVRITRRRYRARRDALAGELCGRLDVTIGGAAAGLHLVAWLPEGVDESLVLDQARSSGIAVHGVHRHSTLAAPRGPGLVVGYGGCDTTALRLAVRSLADLPALRPARLRGGAALGAAA